MRVETITIAILIGLTGNALSKPLEIDGVEVHSDAGRAEKICSCIKSQQSDCLYQEDSGSTASLSFERSLVFAGNKVFSPIFEAGCSVDISAVGKLDDAKIEHFMGACLSPGGSANFFGYRMSSPDMGEVIMSITGPSYLVRPFPKKELHPDGDNGVYTTLLQNQSCDDVSVEEAKRYFEEKQ